MNNTKTILITILAILMFGIPIVLGQSSKHILIVYSTSSDSAQARETNRGMDLYLGSHAEFANTVLFDKYYMNMENPSRQKCEVFLTEMKKLQEIIEDKEPDLVILSGDISQRLIGVRLVNPPPSPDILKRNVVELAVDGKCNTNGQMISEINDMVTRPVNYKPKIVFLSVVSENVKEFGYDNNPKITGIYQRLFSSAVKEAIEDLYSATPEEPDGKPTNLIMVFDDASTNAPPDIQELKTELSKKNAFNVPIKWGGFIGVSTWDKWRETIQAANKNSSMIFIAGYDSIGDQPARSVIRWTEDCAKFPMIGITESYIEDGGMLAITTSNQEQGAASLDLAQQLLANPSDQITYMISSQFTISLNGKLLEKRQITLPTIYESFSRANNTFTNELYDYLNPSGCE